LILEDTDGDGRADKCTTFAGDLHNPTGFEFWNGGVLVAKAPELLLLKDTDGDDKYDVREMLVHGLDTADTHHTSNSFTLDPGKYILLRYTDPQNAQAFASREKLDYWTPVDWYNGGMEHTVLHLQTLDDLDRLAGDFDPIDHRFFLERASRRRISRLRPQSAASEEAERLGRITDQHVLGLLVVIEHHLVGLASDA